MLVCFMCVPTSGPLRLQVSLLESYSFNLLPPLTKFSFSLTGNTLRVWIRPAIVLSLGELKNISAEVPMLMKLTFYFDIQHLNVHTMI